MVERKWFRENGLEQLAWESGDSPSDMKKTRGKRVLTTGLTGEVLNLLEKS